MSDDRVSLEKEPSRPPESVPKRAAGGHRASAGSSGGSRWDWAGAVAEAIGDILEAVFVRWWAD